MSELNLMPWLWRVDAVETRASTHWIVADTAEEAMKKANEDIRNNEYVTAGHAVSARPPTIKEASTWMGLAARDHLSKGGSPENF